MTEHFSPRIQEQIFDRTSHKSTVSPNYDLPVWLKNGKPRGAVGNTQEWDSRYCVTPHRNVTCLKFRVASLPRTNSLVPSLDRPGWSEPQPWPGRLLFA